MERYLRRMGYEVTACQSGRAALSTFGETGADFDVVITDLRLPDVPGGQLLARMREQMPHLRAIVCSGAIPRNSDLQGAEFLQKPYLPRMLVDAIERLVGKAG